MRTAESTATQPVPLTLLCPNCRRSVLRRTDIDELHCDRCEIDFSKEDGFYNLIVGDRFEDSKDDDCLQYEETSNAYTAEHYWLPHIARLTRGITSPRVLALGCGTGIEVDVLNAAGIECVGIDCGNRPRAWRQRRFSQHFFLANGMRLPFETETFDVVFCGCVFPHVGVHGDSFTTTPRAEADRLTLAAEMVRVLRPGGHVIASSPNRLFPLDLFHGRDAGSYVPRINLPWDRFLLSAADYRALFTKAGCGEFRCLTSEDYWGFVRSKKSIGGAALALPVRVAFWITSLEFAPALRRSPVVPWLVVQAQKK